MNEKAKTTDAYSTTVPSQPEQELESTKSKTPIWFWTLGVIALLWNLVGLLAFVAQMMMTEEAMSALPADQQELFKNIPGFVYAFFALAVIAGVMGCVLLLIRSKLAIPVLGLSLLGVLVQYGHMFFMTNTMEVMGAGAMVLPVLVVLISIGLVPYAMMCKSKLILG